MSKLFYIKKLVRDDKATLEFDRFEVYLDEENSLLNRPQIDTSKVEYTEADGGEMISQRLTTGEQVINGLIIPKTNDYWTLRNRLTAFFQTNHTYYIVYEKINGSTLTAGERFKTGTAWISENLQVYPEPRENYSRFTVTLGIGSAGYMEYAEDASGEEIYANSVTVGLIDATTGGLEYDTIGQVWDTVGQVWETGDGGLQPVSTQSTSYVYPAWVVTGDATNPTIRNNTNGTQATYTGHISTGQKLTVEFGTGTAYLDGVNVTRNLSGSLRLEPGTNLIGFEIDSGDITSSTIKWNNYIQ